MIYKIGAILFFGATALAYWSTVGSLDVVIAVGALLAVIGLVVGI